MSATRRDTLAGFAAALAGAALPIAAVAADEPLIALWQRHQEVERLMEVAWSRCRTRADEEAIAEPATEAWRVSIRAIVDARAETFAGLAVKLRVLARDIADGPTDFTDDLIAGALADAERLAGGAP